MTQKISIVVPCFNEAAVLPILYERLCALVVSDDIQLEFILVDDGSSDSTWEQISAIAKSKSDWKAIKLARNFGHQKALWTGLQNVSGDAVFVIDADLQDPPELINEFVERWQAGSDVVYGVRRKRKEGLWKRLAYRAFYRVLSKVADIEIPLDAGDFCLMDRKVVDAMLLTETSQPFIRGARAWVGFRQTPMEYERDARAAGEVKYRFKHLMELAVSGLISYSRKPIRASLFLGVGLMVLASLALVFFGVSFLATGALWGLTLPWVLGGELLVFLCGLQLSALGVVGEYIGRIHEGMENRPVAIVCEVVDQKRKEFEGQDILSMNRLSSHRSATIDSHSDQADDSTSTRRAA